MGQKLVRTLGIDLGLKRTGLALSDEQGELVRLLPASEAKTLASFLEILIKLICEYKIKIIVIGQPEKISKSSNIIISRGYVVKKALQDYAESSKRELKIFFYDESYSSKTALNNLIQAGVKKSRRKILLDSAAAAQIVEDFLAGYNKQDSDDDF